MQSLDAPSLPDEFAGKPIEQFRMRRTVPIEAEVVGRARDSSSEMVMPRHGSRGRGR